MGKTVEFVSYTVYYAQGTELLTNNRGIGCHQRAYPTPHWSEGTLLSCIFKDCWPGAMSVPATDYGKGRKIMEFKVEIFTALYGNVC